MRWGRTGAATFNPGDRGSHQRPALGVRPIVEIPQCADWSPAIGIVKTIAATTSCGGGSRPPSALARVKIASGLNVPAAAYFLRAKVTMPVAMYNSWAHPQPGDGALYPWGWVGLAISDATDSTFLPLRDGCVVSAQITTAAPFLSRYAHHTTRNFDFNCSSFAFAELRALWTDWFEYAQETPSAPCLQIHTRPAPPHNLHLELNMPYHGLPNASDAGLVSFELLEASALRDLPSSDDPESDLVGDICDVTGISLCTTTRQWPPVGIRPFRFRRGVADTMRVQIEAGAQRISGNVNNTPKITLYAVPFDDDVENPYPCVPFGGVAKATSGWNTSATSAVCGLLPANVSHIDLTLPDIAPSEWMVLCGEVGNPIDLENEPVAGGGRHYLRVVGVQFL